MARIQNRYGPNRVGPWGLMQPMADAIKSLTKEDVVPASADRAVHFLAPLGFAGGGVSALRGAAHRPQHGGGEPGLRRGVFLCHWRSL